MTIRKPYFPEHNPVPVEFDWDEVERVARAAPVVIATRGWTRKIFAA